MNKYSKTLSKLDLSGFTLAPPQIFGGIRIVPLVRNEVSEDLRFAKRKYDESMAIAKVGKDLAYYSYVPHALVTCWSNDGTPSPIYGAQIRRGKSDGKVFDYGFGTARVLQKMRAREKKNQLRFLPLHMAMEGFLSYQFGGPAIAWEEYSKTALTTGLTQRFEQSILGPQIAGLEDALRVFEIHENQSGVLLFVGDTLASAFVVPHPDDYRQLHSTLITDFYGELLCYYGIHAAENVISPLSIEATKVNSTADLRLELQRLRANWSDLSHQMAGRFLESKMNIEQTYKLGPFSLQSFMTDLEPKQENHIGEMIVRNENGQIEYLKSFRLSKSQCKRAYLLKQLAEAEWNLDALAQTLGCTKNHLVYRFENAGFGYLLHQHVLDSMRAAKRRKEF